MSAHYQIITLFWTLQILPVLSTLLFFGLVFVACRRIFEEIDNTSSLKCFNASGLYYRYDLIVAAAIYLLCTVMFFFPTLKTISTSLIGPPEDNMWYLWNVWWGKKAVFEAGHQLTFTKYIFFPEGTSLVYNELSWYNFSLSLLLSSFLTPAATYNILMLSTFILSGIGAFLLIKYLVKDSVAALIGGFIFAFNPSHYSHSLHHLNIASIQFIPFFILFFIRTVKGNSKKDLYLSMLFFFLNTACSWTYMIYMGFFMVFSYGYLVVRRKKILQTDIIFKTFLIILPTTLIFSPWLLQMVLIRLAYPGVVAKGHSAFVTDLAALFVPYPYHLIGGMKIIKSIYFNMVHSSGGNTWEAISYLGVVNLFLIIFSFRKSFKHTARYYGGLLVFLLFAMGTQVRVSGEALPIFLPNYLLQYVPLLNNARVPSRFMVFVYLFMAIIIAFAIRDVFSLKWNNKYLRYGLAVISLLIFLDYYSICDLNTKIYKPKCYDVIQTDESFGVLDLPPGYSNGERYLMYQTLHHIPIVYANGISRKVGRSLQDQLYLNDIKKLGKQLTENKVKYIFFHKKLRVPHSNYPMRLQDYRDVFHNIYEDDHQVVFQVY